MTTDAELLARLQTLEASVARMARRNARREQYDIGRELEARVRRGSLTGRWPTRGGEASTPDSLGTPLLARLNDLVQEGAGYGHAEPDFSVPMWHALAAGLPNGNLQQPPASGVDSIITQENFLPYWERVDISGTAITPTYERDVNDLPSVLFSLASGAAGDELVLERVQPIAAHRDQRVTYMAEVIHSGSVAKATIEIQFLKADGLTITGSGSLATQVASGLLNVLETSAAVVPADAVFARIRFGLLRNSSYAVTVTGTVRVYSVRLRQWSAGIYVPDDSDPGGIAAGFINQSDGVLRVMAGGTSPNSNAYVEIGDALTGRQYAALYTGVSLDPNSYTLHLDDTEGFFLNAPIGLSGIVTPTALSAATHNWNAWGGSQVGQIVRASATGASRNLTGIVAPVYANFSADRLLFLENIGSQNIVLVHQSTSSTAANRIICPNSVDFTLYPNQSVLLAYDVTSARWRVYGAAIDGAALAPASVTTTGKLSAGAAVELTGIITPSLGASPNDWSPTGLSGATTIFVNNTSGASINITGIDSTGVTVGRILIIRAAGDQVVLVHQSGASSAANRFVGIGGANVTILNTGGGALIQYLTNPATGESRWNVIAAG